MGPEWITALSAVAGLFGGGAAVYASLVGRISRLQGQVDALDSEIARMVRQQQRLENLILALIGHNPRHLEDFKPDN
jgi:hypothetical protein